MVDLPIVCCMCGDVGFSDKLFRCSKCHHRFQHSYCSNYCVGSEDPVEHCDWCLSEERSSSSSKHIDRKSVSVEKIVVPSPQSEEEKAGKRGNGTPSPRPTTRRYKLLKDVMC